MGIRLEEIPKNVRYNIAPSQGSHHGPHLEKKFSELRLPNLVELQARLHHQRHSLFLDMQTWAPS